MCANIKKSFWTNTNLKKKSNKKQKKLKQSDLLEFKKIENIDLNLI